MDKFGPRYVYNIDVLINKVKLLFRSTDWHGANGYYAIHRNNYRHSSVNTETRHVQSRTVLSRLSTRDVNMK